MHYSLILLIKSPRKTFKIPKIIINSQNFGIIIAILYTEMKYLRILTIIFIVLIYNGLVRADGDGGVTLPVLNYIPGTRAMGLGTAYTALSDDVTSLYWNPAGLAPLIRQEVTALYEKLYEGTTFMFMGYALPVYRIGTFAAGMVYLGTSDIQATGENLEDLGMYSDSQLMLILAYGAPLYNIKKFRSPHLNFLDVGAGLKIIRHSIYNYSSIGVALDVGAKYVPPKTMGFLSGFTFGLLIQNILPPTHKIMEQREWYPLKLKFGTTYRTLYNTLLINLDIKQILFRKTSPEINLGIEYIAMRIFRFRVGYKTGITGGIGMVVQDFSFDYALNYNFDLGFVHQFSASYRFGGPLR